MTARRFAAAVAMIVLAGCSGAAGRAPASSPASSPAPEIAPPPQAVPNVSRDRRGEAGVRAPAQPLVQGRPSSVKCGKLSPSKRDEPTSELLAGRLVLRPPVGAKIPPPAPGAPVLAEESRVVVEAGKEALAIVGREMFQLDPDLFGPSPGEGELGSLDVEAPKFLKATFREESELEIAPVELEAHGAKLRAYVARPREPNAPPGKDTALVLALLVAQPDGVLESVAFYVRGEFVREATGDALVGCTRLAERIASTLAPGPRLLDRAPGRRKLADVSAAEELVVSVPADYVAVPIANGARLYKLRPLSLYAGSITVAIANDADKRAPREGETLPGKLFGRPIQWRGQTSGKGGFLFAAEPLDEKDRGKADVRSAEFLLKASRQPKVLEEFRLVAETSSIVKRSSR